MVDQTFRSPDQTRDSFRSSSSMPSVDDLKDKAVEMAGASADALKSQASSLIDVAKDASSQAADKLKDAAESQKNAGAEVVGNFANAVRRAANEFDNELPIAATYIRKAASGIDGFSEQIKNGDLNDLVRGAKSFARRQPTAFLGIAVLAGFGLVRFLKSSADSAEQSSSSQSMSNHRGSMSDDQFY